MKLSFFIILTITNMAAVQDFDIIWDKFDIVRICTSGNYTQMFFTKMYNYICNSW